MAGGVRNLEEYIVGLYQVFEANVEEDQGCLKAIPMQLFLSIHKRHGVFLLQCAKGFLLEYPGLNLGSSTHRLFSRGQASDLSSVSAPLSGKWGECDPPLTTHPPTPGFW